MKSDFKGDTELENKSGFNFNKGGLLKYHRGGLLKYIRLLSLDVALGALSCGYAATLIWESEVPPGFFILLPLCVWLIYTLDHLLDAHRLREKAHTERHLFHHIHFRSIGFFWCFLALFGGVSALVFLPAKAIAFGLILCVGVVIHLWLVKMVGDRTSPFLIKEAGVAAVYTAGVWGIPVITTGLSGNFANFSIQWLVVFQFFFLALANLLIFSWYEQEIDTLDGHTSFVRAIGKKYSLPLIWLVLGLTLGAMAWMVVAWMGLDAVNYFGFEYSRFEPFWSLRLPTLLVFQIIYLLMWIGLALLLIFPTKFAKKEGYRVLGDGVFLLPGLFFLFLDLFF